MTQEEHTLHTALNRTAPPPAERLGAPYLEVQSTYAVHNRYLRIGLLLSFAVILVMSAERWNSAKEYANRKPLVIRINENGDAAAAPYSMLEYKPREPEIRYFLRNFVLDHFSLIRATAKDAFQRKLFYFTPELSKAAMAEETRTSALASFIASGTEEIDVEVYNVTIEQLATPPYKASVNFDKVFRSGGIISRRERHVMHVQFRILDQVPNTLVTVNPLGLQLTYLRSDQAFEQQPSLSAAPVAARPAGY